MLAAEAEDIQPLRTREQRAHRDDGAGAGEAEHERYEFPLAGAEHNQTAIDQRPRRERCQRPRGMIARAVRQREHVGREQIARIEIDEARAELVDRGPARCDTRRLQCGRDEPDRGRRDAPCQFCDDEEDRQEIDEPQRAERLDEGFQIEQAGVAPARFRRECGSLEAELDCHPDDIEIGEMHHLAVEIGSPVPADHQWQEQARNQEEIRHPERLCESHQYMHEAGLAGGKLDPQHRMHHHDHDDADALGVIDPIDTRSSRGLESPARGDCV